ncbi:MAG: hypothetical protein ACKVOM_01120 [Ferruginibacter sp.]
MRLCVTIIVSFFIFYTSNAQQKDSVEKYIWKNEATGISAAIEIFGLQNTNATACLYFLSKADTIYNNQSDSLFSRFAPVSSLLCPVIKISFYNFYDSVLSNKLKMYAEEFGGAILQDIQKKYKQLPNDNNIVAGMNDFAIVALLSAAGSKIKINKTALFFNSYQADDSLLTGLKASSKGITGKMYLYVANAESDDVFTDKLATHLALNSSIILYKLQQFSLDLETDYFTEAYKWLLANGNNFIIKTAD